MKRIVVIGSSNTDMVIRTGRLPAPGETVLGGEFIMNPGGKGANQAVAAARLGGQVVFVARVGDDMFGREALRGFESAGINSGYVAVDPERPSGVATITVNDMGENCIAVASGANSALSIDDIDRAMHEIDAADVILMQLESPLQTVAYVAEICRHKRGTVILNPAPAQALPDSLLSALDVITPNETEARILTGISVENPDDAEKAARILRDRGVRTAILTLGAGGAFVMSDNYTGHVPACNVRAVDTTAAGDTFNGALAVALAGGMNVRDAVVFANRAAAISVTRLGAQVSVPDLKELETFKFNK